MVTALALELIQCVVKLPEPPEGSEELEEKEKQEAIKQKDNVCCVNVICDR